MCGSLGKGCVLWVEGEGGRVNRCKRVGQQQPQQQGRQFTDTTGQQLKQGGSHRHRLLAGLVGLDDVRSEVRADVWYQTF